MTSSLWTTALATCGLMLPAMPAPAHSDHGMQGQSALAGGAPGVAAEADRVVRITATDNAFDVKHLDVNANETIRFVVTNKGRSTHEFVLDNVRGHKAHEVEMSQMDPNMAMDDDANGVSMQPGQTKELVWKFSAAEHIQFACDIPGHAEQGMKGNIGISGR